MPVGARHCGTIGRVTPTCELCGRSIEEHNRHVRFRLPDPVLHLPDQERTAGTWLCGDDNPARAVLMQVPEVGAFVRVLVPVHLTGGYTVTFGAWLGVHPEDLRRAFEVWWEPNYSSLTLDGRLANALPIWGLLTAPAHAAVIDADASPYVVGSSDPAFAAVLAEQWPHDDLLAALPN